MKKFGQFLFSFVPFLLVIAIQYFAVFFAMGISGLVEFSWYGISGSAGMPAILDDLMYLWLTQDFNVWIMAVYAIISIAVFGLWYYARYGGDYRASRSAFHPLSILGILMLVPGMQYLTTYIISFVATLFPHWLRAYEELLGNAGLDGSLTFGMLLYSILLAAICEELIFRGVTLRQSRKCLPFWAANLLQALLFGAFHMNMIQGIYAFCLGLILGYICEKSSIYNAILLHMLFNFWGTVISQFIYFGDTMFSFLFWFLFAIAMTTGGLFVFTAGTKKCAKS